MLDNLFHSILVTLFLAICSFGALYGNADGTERISRTVVQLERVQLTGDSLKAEQKA